MHNYMKAVQDGSNSPLLRGVIGSTVDWLHLLIDIQAQTVSGNVLPLTSLPSVAFQAQLCS